MMRTSALFSLCFFWMLGCNPEAEDSGTSVGNPTTTALRMAPGEELETMGASTGVATMFLHACDGEPIELPMDREMDLMVEWVEMPAGSWCAVEVVLFSPLHVEGVGFAGGSYFLDLDVGFVFFEASAGWDVDGGAHVFEFGMPGWINATELGVEDGVDVVVNPDTGPHDLLTDRVITESALYEDDGDGQISPDERDDGPVAQPPDDIPDHPTVPDDRTCGCGGGPNLPGLLALALAIGAVRRRRPFRPDVPA
ncbi:MAG: hypothetical protein JRI25_07225 [Deltaproteobacteria bacterium]|nr:hypothetical protein [Deltaproteobacteria bacterium]MBW2254372.1 hypothetical protein [Deltaproteobacteria bacterium]